MAALPRAAPAAAAATGQTRDFVILRAAAEEKGSRARRPRLHCWSRFASTPLIALAVISGGERAEKLARAPLMEEAEQWWLMGLGAFGWI